MTRGRASPASPAAHTKVLVPHNPELLGITTHAEQPAINGTCRSSLPPVLQGWGCSFPDLSGVLQELKSSFVSPFLEKTRVRVYTEESNRLAAFGRLVRVSPIIPGQGMGFTHLTPLLLLYYSWRGPSWPEHLESLCPAFFHMSVAKNRVFSWKHKTQEQAVKEVLAGAAPRTGSRDGPCSVPAPAAATSLFTTNKTHELWGSSPKNTAVWGFLLLLDNKHSWDFWPQ